MTHAAVSSHWTPFIFATKGRRHTSLRLRQQSSPYALLAGMGFALGLCFGLGSLALANVTLRLQNQRATLEVHSAQLAEENRQLTLALAERKRLDVLRAEAERLGLVPTQEITFYDENAQLTQQ